MASTLYLIISMLVYLNVVDAMINTTIPKFSSILVFGDSVVDTGNNKYTTPFLANHLPYGKDFPTHQPTGRVSNGKLVPDFLASILNLKDTVPPYLQPNLTNHDLLTGVCFASAGSGLDELTGRIFNVIPMSKQVENFKAYKTKLVQMVGENQTNQIFAEALVVISVGSNDFILNVYTIPIRSFGSTIEHYQDLLLGKLKNIIKDLYDLGCRKFGITGLPPMGCIPHAITFSKQKNRTCVDNINADSEQYNKKLVGRLPQIQTMLPGSRLVYADLFYTTLNLINHPQQYGMEVTNLGCCGLGTIEVGPLCFTDLQVCSDVSKYLYWDSFHLTEAGYLYLMKYVEKDVLPQFNF